MQRGDVRQGDELVQGGDGEGHRVGQSRDFGRRSGRKNSGRKNSGRKNSGWKNSGWKNSGWKNSGWKYQRRGPTGPRPRPGAARRWCRPPGRGASARRRRRSGSRRGRGGR
ncbi:hypothetical protein [Methylobacterium sp. Leaf113]|uniref:hypothetical protein n=1 Tax=Methylobacterium sp. Leaf113 TaxID=1736259 RepID=UPI003FCC3E86